MVTTEGRFVSERQQRGSCHGEQTKVWAAEEAEIDRQVEPESLRCLPGEAEEAEIDRQLELVLRRWAVFPGA
jgi:hypothetical protein